MTTDIKMLLFWAAVVSVVVFAGHKVKQYKDEQDRISSLRIRLMIMQITGKDYGSPPPGWKAE